MNHMCSLLESGKTSMGLLVIDAFMASRAIWNLSVHSNDFVFLFIWVKGRLSQSDFEWASNSAQLKFGLDPFPFGCKVWAYFWCYAIYLPVGKCYLRTASGLNIASVLQRIHTSSYLIFGLHLSNTLYKYSKRAVHL